MKISIKYLFVFLLPLAILSCTKNDVDINGAANTATAGSSNLALTNRVVSAFVLDTTTLPGLTAGSLPALSRFRKLLTYDTLAAANKAPLYNVGDVVNFAGFMKGDDTAIAKRKITIRFFQPPTSFITPTALFPLQRAEDSYRGFAPASADVLNTISLPAISTTLNDSVKVSVVNNEKIGGINYSTYLIRVSYKIPAVMSGKLISINLSANTSGAASDLGNVNWIYAFRVR